jgi:large subunit ribosomal protein L30
MSDASYVKVTQVRSAIGIKPKQRGTLRAIGLRRPGSSRVHLDSANLRGMIARVSHLVAVEASSVEPSPISRRSKK